MANGPIGKKYEPPPYEIWEGPKKGATLGDIIRMGKDGGPDWEGPPKKKKGKKHKGKK